MSVQQETFGRGTETRKLILDNYKQLDSPPPLKKKHDAAPVWYQLLILGVRAARSGLRIAVVHFMVFMGVAALASIVWFRRGYDLSDLSDRMGLIFFLQLQFFVFAMMGTINSYIPERMVVKKEFRGQFYNLFHYFTSKSAVEFLLDIPTPLGLSSILYWVANLNPDPVRFLLFIVILLSGYVAGQSIGLAIAALVPNPRVAPLFGLLYFFMSGIMGGFFVRPSRVPVFIRWLQYTTPLRYIFDATIVNEFDDDSITYNVDGKEVKSSELLDSLFELVFHNVWHSLLVIWAFAIGFRIFALIVLRLLINH